MPIPKAKPLINTDSLPFISICVSKNQKIYLKYLSRQELSNAEEVTLKSENGNLFLCLKVVDRNYVIGIPDCGEHIKSMTQKAWEKYFTGEKKPHSEHG